MLYQIMNDIQQSYKKNEMNCKYELFRGKAFVNNSNKQQKKHVCKDIHLVSIIFIRWMNIPQNVSLNVIFVVI